MAVLGVQLVLSMVLASILSKVTPRHSFARWLLCSRLVRYLYPSEEELRKQAGIPPPKHKNKKPDDKRKEENFTVPKTLDIQLESARVTAVDVLPLHFYTEYQWLLDFSMCSVLIYSLTEVYYLILQPKSEFNLSMLWCLLVLGFSIKILYSLTAIYFKTEEGGEKIICIIFGFFFLVFSMGVLIVNENTLEFGLESAYFNFSQSAQNFLRDQGLDSAGPASFLTYKIILAIISAVLGAFLTFPGLRLAKMHSDSLKYAKDRPLFQVMLHVNIVLPLILSTMWLKPVMRDLLVHRGTQIMSNEVFDHMRVCALLLFCLIRLLLVWPHLQSHLNLAWEKVNKLKKEAGRIKAVDLQKMVIRVFYYLCVVTLQYLAPVVLLLFTTLMLKTLGGFSILETFGLPVPALVTRTESPPRIPDDPITASATQFSLALSTLRQVFTPVFFRATLSYMCWWICTAWFITSAFGLIYYSYFESALS